MLTISPMYDESSYRFLLTHVLANGEDRMDRTGVGIRSMFAPPPMKFYLHNDRFPLLTSKKVPWKSVLAETLWFAQGRNDLESLRADGCTWWDSWEKADGTIGPGYGEALRHWTNRYGVEVDQLSRIIKSLKEDPNSRRHVMTMWNAGEIDDMALPPCHGALIQFYVGRGGTSLSCQVNIRSSDMFLGLPTNIAGYALLTRMVAHVTGYKANSLTVVLGDAHIYSNHKDAVEELLSRDGYPEQPTLTIDSSVKDIDLMRPEHFTLNNYNPLPAIKAPVAV